MLFFISSARMMWHGPNVKRNKPEARRHTLIIKNSPDNFYLRQHGIICLANHEIGTHYVSFVKTVEDKFLLLLTIGWYQVGLYYMYLLPNAGRQNGDKNIYLHSKILRVFQQLPKCDIWKILLLMNVN